jgi:ATP-binding cassette subfamily B protein
MLWNDSAIMNPAAFCKPPHVASSPQHAGFFSADIESNIRMGYPVSPEKLNRALWLAAFKDAVEAMKEGRHTLAGPRGSMLSGGEGQRLSLARMFARNAELNIIDDSVSALDEHTQGLVKDRLIAHIKNSGHGVVMVTNSKPFLLAAHRIIVMKQGSIIAQGDYGELMKGCGEFRVLVS